MMQINHRRPKDIYILDSAVSLSGRFMCFYGQHFERGKICYVVGVSDITNGEIIMRHYKEGISLAPRAMASTVWEIFKRSMTERSEHHGQYETDEASLQLESWFTRAVGPGTSKAN